MIKTIKNTLLVFGFSLVAGLTIAHAVPLVIETNQGTCFLEDENQTHWIYICENGAFVYVPRNQGGSGGGNNGGADPNECEEYC